MAGRIRSIKPEWTESESLGSCSDAARVLSVTLILVADDHGNGRAHPGYLAGQAWCYSGASPSKAESALAELVEIGFVSLYEVGGQAYFHLPGWTAHQRVDKPGKPRVPSPRSPALSAPAGRVAYFVRGTVTGLIKIGASSDPVKRLATLAIGSEPLELLAVGGVESDLHRQFASARVHGEWFRQTDELVAVIAGLSAIYPEPIATAGSRESLARPAGDSRESLAPDHDHDHEKDHDHEGEREGGDSPPAREKRAPSGEAFELADRLREAVLAAKPNDKAGEEGAWKATRPSWAKTLDRTLKRRPASAIQAVLAYLARGQDGADYPFVVLSAKALDEKLDRIETAMAKAKAPRAGGHFKVTGAEVYAGGEVDL